MGFRFRGVFFAFKGLGIGFRFRGVLLAFQGLSFSFLINQFQHCRPVAAIQLHRGSHYDADQCATVNSWDSRCQEEHESSIGA